MSRGSPRPHARPTAGNPDAPHPQGNGPAAAEAEPIEPGQRSKSRGAAPEAGPDRGLEARPLAPGLYVVATPIGNLGDITLRALDVLSRADLIACEDTRVTRRLLAALGLSTDPRRLLPYHDHNEREAANGLVARVAAGKVVALVSDAGMPLLSDPGFRLVAAARAAGVAVTCVPGPSAALAALAVAGLPASQVLFAGFPPRTQPARRALFAAWTALPATIVLFESPQRLAATLDDLAAMLGPRQAAVTRELTKAFEEVATGSLAALAQRFAGAPPRGEVTLVVGPPSDDGAAAAGAAALDDALRDALARYSLRDAVAAVAAALDLPRKTVYARALVLGAETGTGGGEDPPP